MTKFEVNPKHPRAESIQIREKLVEATKQGIVAHAGLIAQGRGEAFDYLIGEKTTENAAIAIKTAAAAMLTAKLPVISVNGNTAALVPKEIVELSQITHAKIEVNLYYRTPKRDLAIKKLLEAAGAKEILGVGKAASSQIPEINSERRRVDPKGILEADVVLVPLEDGDRAEALQKMGKTVIAFDLNPLSRTAQCASITIVDNITRAFPQLIEEAKAMQTTEPTKLKEIVTNFNNKENLKESIRTINTRLLKLAT